MYKPKAYLLLGRYGDVCNLLPLIEYEAKAHNYTPKLFISKDFANLLDGCSYVDPVIWGDSFWNYQPALGWARGALQSPDKNETDPAPGHELVDCSLSGRGYLLIKRCRSFVRESWRLSKCPVPWGHLPLTFDRRSPEREKQLLEIFNLKEGEPIVLVATKGNSSPFNELIDLSAFLTNELKEFRVIDLSEVKAERFYDMIGLLEKAHCLVTIDTGILHLARAVPSLPVITLVPNDETRWLQSDWDPQHILRLQYKEVLSNTEIILSAVREGNSFIKQKIHFITSHAIKDEDTQRRVNFAVSTRVNENEYSKRWNFMEFPADLIEKRNSLSMGDSKKLPFVKDMVDYAADKANDYDFIMICNADICFTPGITGWLLHETERCGAVYFHRYNFAKIGRSIINEEDVMKGTYYVGSDAFAFSKEWWIKNRDIFPDMIFGREAWDLVFRNMVRRSGGYEIPLAIYHEAHEVDWVKKEVRENKATMYNITLAKKWINTYGGDWNDWRYSNSIADSAKLRYK